MIINHNMNAMNALRMMNSATKRIGNAMEKLSAGMRINRAGDDAAGLAISEKMRAQIRGLEQASRNVQDAISLIQTAEGGMNEIHSLLQRGRELSVGAANGTLNKEDKARVQEEVNQIIEEIDRISDTTNFNTIPLLKADKAGAAKKEDAPSSLTFQLGSNGGNSITVELANMSSAELGLSLVDVKEDANAAITSFANAIGQVSTQRARFGAVQNRLEHALAISDNTAENLIAAESRIRDVDMAKAMMEFAKANILEQAAQAMLAQANQQPQQILQLLRS